VGIVRLGEIRARLVVNAVVCESATSPASSDVSSLIIACADAVQGHSAPQEQLYDYFGFNPKDMANRIDVWAKRWQGESRLPGVGEFEELLLGVQGH
jgi:hypothetical protein